MSILVDLFGISRMWLGRACALCALCAVVACERIAHTNHFGEESAHNLWAVHNYCTRKRAPTYVHIYKHISVACGMWRHVAAGVRMRIGILNAAMLTKNKKTTYNCTLLPSLSAYLSTSVIFARASTANYVHFCACAPFALCLTLLFSRRTKKGRRSVHSKWDCFI